MNRKIFILVLLLATLVACGGTPEPTIVPRKTIDQPTEQSVQPTVAPPTNPPATPTPPPVGDILYERVESSFEDSLWLIDSTTKQARRVTPSGTQISRFWMPDANHVVFDGSVALASGPYLLDVHSGQLTQITPDAQQGWWSSDKKRYIYLSQQGGQPTLNAVSYDGSNRRQFTPDFKSPQDVILLFAVDRVSPFSGDGGKVAFVGRRVGSDGILSPFGLYVADTNSRTNVRLTETTEGENTNFWLSPSGDYLAFLEGDHPSHRLRVLQVAGGAQVFEVPDGVRSWTSEGSVDPTFSPGSPFMRFQHAEDGEVLVNLTTGQRMPLRTLGGEHASISQYSEHFSPDGRWLAFTGGNGNSWLTIALSLDTLTPTTLANGSGSGFVWSPDGRYVAYSTWDPSGASDSLFHLSSLTGETIANDESASGISTHIWSPTSQALLFHREKDGTYVWPVGQAPIQLAKCWTHYDCPNVTNDHVRSFAWSPDGNQVLFAANQSGAWGLYVMSASGSNLRKIVPDSVAGAIWVKK